MTQPAADDLFHQILNSRHYAMARLARRITHDHHLAEDACQGAYLELHRALLRGAQISNYQAWLRSVVANKARAAVSACRAPGDDTPALIDTLADSPPGPEPLLDSAERLDLQDAINHLPSDQRESFVLRALRGLSCRDTAAAVGCSEREVRRRLRGAVKALLHRLGSPGER